MDNPACNDILISLHPEHSDNVLNGRKTVELRRRRLHVAPGTRVWIYTKQPRGQVDAYAIVEAVHDASPGELWTRFGRQVAISRSAFDDYLSGSDTGCAIVFASVWRLNRAIGLDEIRRKVARFHPPQFFKRLDADSAELAVLCRSTHSS